MGNKKKLGSLTKKNKYNLCAYTRGSIYSPGGWLQPDGNSSHGFPTLKSYSNSKERNALKMPSTHCNWLCQQVKISLKWIFHFKLGFLMTRVSLLCLQQLFAPFLWKKKQQRNPVAPIWRQTSTWFSSCLYLYSLEDASQTQKMNGPCLNEFWWLHQTLEKK